MEKEWIMEKTTKIFKMIREKTREEDLQAFVSEYNSAFSRRVNEIVFNMNKPIMERIFKVFNFRIQLNDEEKIKELLLIENKYLRSEGFAYCPCKIEHIAENICPCVTCIEEINENGHCHCRMFIKKEENNLLIASTVSVLFFLILLGSLILASIF